MSKPLLNPSTTLATTIDSVYFPVIPQNFHSLNFPVIPNCIFRLPRLKSSIAPAKRVDNVLAVLHSEGCIGKNGFHKLELKVRDSELDQDGVVNHAVYARYCEHGRHQLLQSIGVDADTIARSGGPLALSEQTFKFLLPLKSGDRFVVKMRVFNITAARVFVEHFIFKLPNEEAILEAKCTCVWLDKNFRPIRIPLEVRSKFKIFLQDHPC